MTHEPVRVYADTSVYGGVFDEEFEDASRTFFDQVQAGRFRLITSTAVGAELEDAPPRVRVFFRRMRRHLEIVDITDPVLRLQQAYLRAEIVAEKWAADTLHVSVATVARCRLIVSWNFKHIVNFRRIPLYNGINLSQGYETIGIYSPQEVIADED